MAAGTSRNRICSVLAWLIGVVFIYAACLKIAEPAVFAQSIKHYRILPLAAVNATALLLPWWEIAAGISLFLPGWRRAGALTVFFLTSIFVVAIISAMARGLDISCGCFGSYSARVGIRILTIDLAILAATVFILSTDRIRP